MVDRIIARFVALMRRHGFIVLSESNYDKLLSRIELNENVTAGLMEWRETHENAPVPSRGDEPTPAEILNEWLNGEAKNE